MKKLLLVMLGLAFALSLNAQTADKKWNIGLHGGAIQYNGDLGNDFFKTDQAFYGFGGLSLTRFLGNRLDVSLFLTKGETGYMADAGRFRHQLTTGTINFRLNLIGADYFVRPYIFAGGGVMMFANTLEDTKNNEKFDFAAPSFGAGLNLRMGKAVTLNLQETFMYSSSDERDGIVKNSNDFFLLHSVGLTFNFGQKSDADGDGIADRLDKCPDTPAGVVVDENGCPLDGDGDGVADYLDKCENTPAGASVDSRGCWVIQGIQFVSGKSDITPEFYPVLDQVMSVLRNEPDLKVEIQGYTDSKGSLALNQRLSEDRAKRIMQYFIDKGVDSRNLSATGFGPSNPAATNDTPEGRAQNRRVELKPVW